MSTDLHMFEPAMLTQRERDLIDYRISASFDLRGVGPEANGLEDLDLAVFDDDLRGALVGAAIVVLEAVDGLVLVRAAIQVIEHAVTVFVAFGAAVVVFDAVEVFGQAWA